MKSLGLGVLFLSALAARAGAAAPAQDCRAKFSMGGVLEENAAPSAPALEDAMRWELLAYYKWTAFAKGDPAACSPLKNLRFLIDTSEPPAAGDALCRDLVTRLNFARGFAARSPDLPRLCLADIMTINSSRKPDEAQLRVYRDACALIVRSDLPVEELCPRALAGLPFPEKMRAKQLRRCVCDFTSMNGQGKCHDDPANDPAGFIGPYRYDAFNALHEALAAKDPERCGGLELCRGLAGQAAAMAAVHAKKAADLRCAPGGASAPR